MRNIKFFIKNIVVTAWLIIAFSQVYAVDEANKVVAAESENLFNAVNSVIAKSKKEEKKQNASSAEANNERVASLAPKLTNPLVAPISTTNKSKNTSAEDNSVIPTVPVSVVSNIPKPISQKAAKVLLNKDPLIQLSPGENVVIPISIGNPNRIITPFNLPSVIASSIENFSSEESCNTVCVRENIVYVATQEEDPISMFITETGIEGTALNVTVVPRRIPPRQVTLKFKEGSVNLASLRTVSNNGVAQKWEESQPFIATVKSLLKALALGKIPPGHTLDKVDKKDKKIPVCKNAGFMVNFRDGQFISGHNLNTYIGQAKNITHRPLEFKEVGCADWGTVAITAFPKSVVYPNQVTEVMVVKRNIRQQFTSKRPVLY